MSDKLSKKTVAVSQPALLRTLFGAISEHEAALARISRRLHDDVSQIVSAVGLQLDAMRMDFRNEAPGIEHRAAEIQTMLELVIEQLRDISNELNPSIVERAGLQFALDRLAGKIRERFSGTLRLQLDPATLVPTVIAKAFYQIVEGAIEEGLARPGCSLIEIQLKRSQGEFVLEVRHNGKAHLNEDSEASFERLRMDYYASKSQVALDVSQSPNGGTVVRASYPMPAPESGGTV
ncbi:MAG TPA: histidine kinase [Bryobacteraceae bacterium]|nr:histidine kinase [Bryobacteraceae bacterium]